MLEEAELKVATFYSRVMEMVRIKMEDIREIAQCRFLGDGRYRCFGHVQETDSGYTGGT